MIRVLLDEDLDIRLRTAFAAGVSVETVVHRGWRGTKNGELLRRASEHFDVLVTCDANLPAQQNLSKYQLAVVVLRPRSKTLRDLQELVPVVEGILPALQRGRAVEVYPPETR